MVWEISDCARRMPAVVAPSKASRVRDASSDSRCRWHFQNDATSALNYGTGSIFEWNLQASSTTDPGVVADAATGTYDSVVANGAPGSVTGGASIFKVVLGGNSFTDAFWNTDKSWNNIFTGTGAPALLGSIFNSFSATGGLTSTGLVEGEGQFTFNGATSTLNWSAVPEPSSALAGLLIGAGLLRPRRK